MTIRSDNPNTDCVDCRACRIALPAENHRAIEAVPIAEQVGKRGLRVDHVIYSPVAEVSMLGAKTEVHDEIIARVGNRPLRGHAKAQHFVG